MNSKTISYSFPDGRVYVGAIKNNRPNGIGTMTFPNGDVFEGSWIDGCMDGEGVYRFYDANKDKFSSETCQSLNETTGGDSGDSGESGEPSSTDCPDNTGKAIGLTFLVTVIVFAIGIGLFVFFMRRRNNNQTTEDGTKAPMI